MSQIMTGGCQCGRVRYRAEIGSDDAYLCHCRMCRKATGGFAASFVQLPVAGVTWESEPAWYQSSPIARRAFCPQCGTPLAFDFIDSSGEMDLTVGSFDDPARFRPAAHAGSESLLEAWIDTSAIKRHYTAESENVAKRWQAVGREVPE